MCSDHLWASIWRTFRSSRSGKGWKGWMLSGAMKFNLEQCDVFFLTLLNCLYECVCARVWLKSLGIDFSPHHVLEKGRLGYEIFWGTKGLNAVASFIFSAWDMPVLFILLYWCCQVPLLLVIMLVKVLLPSLALTLCYQSWSKFCYQFCMKGQITSSLCHLNLSELKWVQASFSHTPIQWNEFLVVFVLVKCNSECIYQA